MNKQQFVVFGSPGDENGRNSVLKHSRFHSAYEHKWEYYRSASTSEWCGAKGLGCTLGVALCIECIIV